MDIKQYMLGGYQMAATCTCLHEEFIQSETYLRDYDNSLRVNDNKLITLHFEHLSDMRWCIENWV